MRGVASQRRWCRIARAGKGPEEAGAPGRRGDPGSASQEAPRPATAPRPELSAGARHLGGLRLVLQKPWGEVGLP